MAAGRDDLAREALARRAGVTAQLDDLDHQHASLQAEEDRLTLAAQRLQAQVEAFRTRKETVRATYTAAEAQTRIGEALAGVTELDRLSATVDIDRELAELKGAGPLRAIQGAAPDSGTRPEETP